MSNKMIVRKANDLIEAIYRLTVGEQKIVQYLIAQIKPWDEDFKPYQLNVEEFCEYMGVTTDHVYDSFVYLSKSLASKTIMIGRGEKTYVVSWLAQAEYAHGEGYINLLLAPELKNVLLNLTGCYTSYHLDNIKPLCSTYSIRMYELLKQYEDIGQRTFGIEQLKEILDVKYIYPLYGNFKIRVLNIAQRELLENTDINFEYKEFKKNRRVVKLEFTINSNRQVENDDRATAAPAPPKDEKSKQPEQPRNIKSLLSFMDAGYYDFDFEYKDCQIIYKNAKGDVDVIRYCYGVLLERDQVDNPTGWMIKAVREPEAYGYDRNATSQPESKKAFKPRLREKKNRFNNFTPGKTDHDAWERMENENMAVSIKKAKDDMADQPRREKKQ